MSAPPGGTVDPRVQVAVGNLLRAGVLLAVAVVLIGAALYLLRFGHTVPSYRTFQGVSQELRHPVDIVRYAFAEHGRGVIQLGLILLVATPVARVAMTAVAFALERDRAYVVIASIVLLLLLFSLFS